MKKTFFVILTIIFNSFNSTAQTTHVIYPPVREKISVEELFMDTSLILTSCVRAGKAYNYFTHVSVTDQISVPGWLIVSSWWSQDDTSDSLKISGRNMTVNLHETDSGFEYFTDPETFQGSIEQYIVGVHIRQRPIFIVNTHTCKIIYQESENFFLEVKE